jgi:hypothetical protein
MILLNLQRQMLHFKIKYNQTYNYFLGKVEVNSLNNFWISFKTQNFAFRMILWVAANF